MTYRLFVLPLVAAVTLAAPALAQLPRTPVTVAAEPNNKEPSFRDPKTGQVWTPENVGEDGKPVAPQDRAFNPAGQAVANQQVLQQEAKVHTVGTVPITAGPTVPLVAIDNPALRVIPGGRWRLVIYLQNNSGSTLAPSLLCRFTNGGKLVLATYVTTRPLTGGERVGLSIAGPPAYDFVDSATCAVTQP